MNLSTLQDDYNNMSRQLRKMHKLSENMVTQDDLINAEKLIENAWVMVQEIQELAENLENTTITAQRELNYVLDNLPLGD